MSQSIQNTFLDSSPLRILIIENSADDVQRLQRLLTSPAVCSVLPPLVIHHASTGIESLQAYHSMTPDCILVNHNLPDMSGLDLVQNLRTLETDITASIVLLTDVPMDDVGLEAMRNGLQDCLVKDELTEQKLCWTLLRARERAELYRRLNGKQEELSSFAGTAAHDIITPLSNLSLFIEHLQETMVEEADEELTENFGAIVSIVDHMTSLMEGLSTFAQMGGHQTLYSYVDLQQIYDYMLLLFDYELEISEATIRADRLPTIYGNQVGLSQLLQNLIGNAIKYRAEERPVIQIRSGKSNGYWHLSVSDNGIGIAPMYHREIFAPFQRLHSRSEYPGSGLGLATCKRVVDQHGGRIWVDSEPGAGTTVHVLLPIRIPATDDFSLNIDDGEAMVPGHRYPDIDWDALLDKDGEGIILPASNPY